MAENKTNKRHKSFKMELRRYHDSINRGNRYNLPKISGKLNVFEAKEPKGDEAKEEKSSSKKYEIVRVIPNTGLTIISDGVLKGIGDNEGNVILYPKYGFIQGAMGDNTKVIPCVLDNGDIDYFDVNTQSLNECAVGGGLGVASVGAVTDTSSATDATQSGGKDDYHEIDYDKVKKDLTIPYLCGYRIKDMRSGKLLNKGIKRKKHKSKRKSR